ncbi:MAG: HAMP domain-containing sensor histidine kinase [Burkholderiaceae bacterium]
MHEARRRFGHSIGLRMVGVFVLLAIATTVVFVIGAQRSFSIGWREAAQPLLIDYVDRLAAQIVVDGTPNVEAARSLAARLPITVRITGPIVNWRSHPPRRAADAGLPAADHELPARGFWTSITRRTTADGHAITFGIDREVFERRPHGVGLALAALLGATLLAWFAVRRLLAPLGPIGQGARRFGAGDFKRPIDARWTRRPDEFGELASTLNTMGHDIEQMLEAKRALLLAISHELRSPLTRARLNVELLPESADVQPQRQALLNDLREMASLIADLLESERLAAPHAALHREPVDLVTLAGQVRDELQVRHPAAAMIRIVAEPSLPQPMLDAARMRLLLRNLLDNALRHGGEAAVLPPELHLRRVGNGNGGGGGNGDSGERGLDGIEIEVRDHGPGVADDQLARLAQAFYRPDRARSRDAGGVGLGLYLCRLVAQAHGGRFALRNAHPGLAVTVTLPG